jgi:hypothetical protein
VTIQEFKDSINRLEIVKKGFEEKKKDTCPSGAIAMQCRQQIIEYLEKRIEKSRYTMKLLVQSEVMIKSEISQAINAYRRKRTIEIIHYTGEFIRALNVNCLNAHDDPPRNPEILELV